MTKREIKKIEKIKSQLENLQGKLYDFSSENNIEGSEFDSSYANYIDNAAFEMDISIQNLEYWLRDNKK